jgi:hypothetical protein
MKATQNYHDKIGFVAFYVKALNQTQQYKSAENYCESLLRVYKEQIFKHRWHLFFTVYLETLLYQEQYSKIHKIIQKEQLLEKEKNYQKRPSYLPTISWYAYVAAFREAQFSKHQFSEIILNYTQHIREDKHKFKQIAELLKRIQPHIPEVVQLIRPKLYDWDIRL